MHSQPYLWDSRELVRAAAHMHQQRQQHKRGPTGFGGAAGVHLQAVAAGKGRSGGPSASSGASGASGSAASS